MQRFPFVVQHLNLTLLFVFAQFLIFVDELGLFFHIAAQHDVGTSTGHIGGDGDGTRTTGLRDDVRFAFVLFGVQNIVRNLRLCEQIGQQFRGFNRGRTNQCRLTALHAVFDVFNHRLEFFLCRAIDQILLISANDRAIGRNDHGFQTVNLLEFVGFGVRRAGHAAEFFVHAEVVLEGDRGHRHRFGLHRYAFFGFHRLVQTVRPATTGHQTTGEFVHDDDFVVLHYIFFVLGVQLVRTQSGKQEMHQGDVLRVIQV